MVMVKGIAHVLLEHCLSMFISSIVVSPGAKPFVFEGAEVCVVMRDGAPWFVLADVCKVLGISNPSNASARLDADERQVVDLAALHNVEGFKPNGMAAGMNTTGTIINESGLYSTILTSRKPAARRFKKWVTGTVLPAIRKDGAYVLGEEKVIKGELSEDELVLHALEAQQRKVARLKEERARLLRATPATPRKSAKGTLLEGEQRNNDDDPDQHERHYRNAQLLVQDARDDHVADHQGDAEVIEP